MPLFCGRKAISLTSFFVHIYQDSSNCITIVLAHLQSLGGYAKSLVNL